MLKWLNLQNQKNNTEPVMNSSVQISDASTQISDVLKNSIYNLD